MGTTGMQKSNNCVLSLVPLEIAIGMTKSVHALSDSNNLNTKCNSSKLLTNQVTIITS